MESQGQILLRLMEEEISHYEELVGELKKEADCLRQGSPEDLLGPCSSSAARRNDPATPSIHTKNDCGSIEPYGAGEDVAELMLPAAALFSENEKISEDFG